MCFLMAMNATLLCIKLECQSCFVRGCKWPPAQGRFGSQATTYIDVHIYYFLTMIVFLTACFSKDIEDQCNGTLYLKRRCVQNTTENYLQYKQSLSERKWPTDEFFKYVLQSLNCHDNLHFVEVERVMHQNALCWSVMGTDPKNY